MRHKSPGIALVGEDVLKRTFPTFITASATSLILDSTSKMVVHDLARLIGACCHLRHLHIAANRVLNVASCIPRPLEELSYLCMDFSRDISPDELIALIRLVPNVRQMRWLPPTSSPLGEDAGAVAPLALHTLNANSMFHTSVLLAPMLTHRWIVGELILSIDPSTLQLLQRCHLGPGDLPATSDLKLIIYDICNDETAPLHALIAACHLRSLAVQASAEKTGRLLATALGACDGLRGLTLVFEDFEDAEDVQAVADTLVTAMPRALRSLELFILPLYSPRFNALRSVCRSRRIILNITSV